MRSQSDSKRLHHGQRIVDRLPGKRRFPMFADDHGFSAAPRIAQRLRSNFQLLGDRSKQEKALPFLRQSCSLLQGSSPTSANPGKDQPSLVNIRVGDTEFPGLCDCSSSSGPTPFARTKGRGNDCYAGGIGELLPEEPRAL